LQIMDQDKKTYRRILFTAVICLLVSGSAFLGWKYFSGTDTSASGIIQDRLQAGAAGNAEPKYEQNKLSPAELYMTAVKRTYSLDILFHREYNAQWEGANGAIGDAFLYAATGDSRLLALYRDKFRLTEIGNGTWVDDRAWACLAELYWWDFSGRKNKEWVEDARKRYIEAKREGRLTHYEGFWSWYNYPPAANSSVRIFTNSNMNQMVNVACRLYEATGEKQFYRDAILVWNGDSKIPGVEKEFYKGNGIWKGAEGPAAFGKQFPWEGAGMCAIGASMYRMTGDMKYRDIVVSTAKRLMDPANGWVDSSDFYQLKMDGNGSFVHYILDAYMIAPELLQDIPEKVGKMLEHVWTNNHGRARLTLHRPIDHAVRNGWNPNGGEDGYNVNEVGTIHPQSQAVRAFGVYAYVLYKLKEK
jgi:hypothetical protein